MNIKEQVLSIEQVRELRELGFDVNKHASVKIHTIYSDKDIQELK